MLRNNGRHNFRSPFGIQPSLVLDFAGTGTLDPRVTFTRSTTGTYYNSSGVLSIAAINVPRFDYNPSTLAPLGLLIEQSSTNLLTYSQTFSNAVWIAGLGTASFSSTTTTAPDGTATAGTLLSSLSTGTHSAVWAYTSYVAGTYTLSWYIQANTNNFSSIYFASGSATNAICTVNLSTGAITKTGSNGNLTYISSSITLITGTYYRVSLTVALATTTSLVVGIQNNSSENPTYINGGPESWTALGTESINIWGSQLETLAFPTSYIPTTSAQVTRASDNASMTGTNFSSWYNNEQGTLFVSSLINRSVNGSNGNYYASISDGTLLNNILLAQVSGVIGLIESSGTLSFNQTLGNNASLNNITAQMSLSYSSTSSYIALNGSVGSQVTNAVIPSVNSLQIGRRADSSPDAYLNGWVKKFSFYPIAFTGSQNQALTGS